MISNQRNTVATADIKNLDVTATAGNSPLAAHSCAHVSRLVEAHGATTLTTLSVPISNDKAPLIVEAPKGVLQKPSETSLKKKEANRRNALKSTGPRTKAGKGTARFNAMKHGFLSK